MSRPLAPVAMLACACALAGPASAVAQDPPSEIPDIAVSEAQSVTTGPSYAIASASDTPELWATVNICDTAQAPDSMGVRASMPGNGTRQRMFMRFSAEYWSRSRQAWTPVAGTGVSPWVFVGSAEYARRQAGWTFHFAAPPSGVTFTMRANVEFEWRRSSEPAAQRGDAKAHRRAVKGHRRAAKRHRRVLERHRRGSSRYRRFDSKGSRAAQTDVVRSVVRATETGIEGVHGGDPAGTSKAMCLIY
jgi:hypothetical protein